MSRIHGKDTKPEMILRRALWHRGLRYRLHYKLPGHPDIVFIKSKTVIFVDGCFWHGCPEHGQHVKTNRSFWNTKIRKNKERDKEVARQLKEAGWTVLRFWEHDIHKDLSTIITAIIDSLKAHLS